MNTWKYIHYDENGPKQGEPQLPPGGTAYLAFDVCRWAVVIGYTEYGGSSSILGPDVNDDCCIVAFAALHEAEPPAMERILATGGWTRAQYPNAELVKLFRG